MGEQESDMVKTLRKHLESLTEEEKEQLRKDFQEAREYSVGPTVDEYIEFLEKTTPKQ